MVYDRVSGVPRCKAERRSVRLGARPREGVSDGLPRCKAEREKE